MRSDVGAGPVVGAGSDVGAGFSRTHLFPVPAAALVLGRAQPHAPARARRLAARPAVRRRRAGRRWGAVLGCVLADLAARGLRRIRRLPAAPRPVVALPLVPGLPCVQRHRHGAVLVLSLRRSAAADDQPDCGAQALCRALHAHAGIRVVDGDHLHDAGAVRYRRRQVRAAGVLSHGGGHGRAVRHHSGRARVGLHAVRRQRISRPSRARPADADGPGLRSRHRPAAAIHSARAADARGVAAGYHGLLRHVTVADHASVAVVLGRRGAVRGDSGRRGLAAPGRVVDDGRRIHRVARRRARTLALRRIQSIAGGAEDALRASSARSMPSRPRCRCRPCGVSCSSRT